MQSVCAVGSSGAALAVPLRVVAAVKCMSCLCLIDLTYKLAHFLEPSEQLLKELETRNSFLFHGEYELPHERRWLCYTRCANEHLTLFLTDYGLGKQSRNSWRGGGALSWRRDLLQTKVCSASFSFQASSYFNLPVYQNTSLSATISLLYYILSMRKCRCRVINKV